MTKSWYLPKKFRPKRFNRNFTWPIPINSIKKRNTLKRNLPIFFYQQNWIISWCWEPSWYLIFVYCIVFICFVCVLCFSDKFHVRLLYDRICGPLKWYVCVCMYVCMYVCTYVCMYVCGLTQCFQMSLSLQWLHIYCPSVQYTYYPFGLTVIIVACCENVNRIWTCIESHLFILFLVGNSWLANIVHPYMRFFWMKLTC